MRTVLRVPPMHSTASRLFYEGGGTHRGSEVAAAAAGYFIRPGASIGE